MSARPAPEGVPSPVRLFAAVVAALLGLLPPAFYHLAERRAELAGMRATGHVLAQAVSDLAARNPALWTFEAPRVSGLLAMSGGDEAGWRRVVMPDGAPLATEGAFPGSYVLRIAVPIYENGREVATLEIRRNAWPITLRSALVALGAAALAGLAYALLHILPMRLLARAVARAAHLASHDPLTGLPNRAVLSDRLRAATVSYRRRSSGSLSVLCLDLDGFKEVNDSLCHAAGDALLREVALRLAACLREDDTLARLGGDEFAVVVADADPPGGPAAVATRLLAAFDAPFDLPEGTVRVGVSIGIASVEWPEPADPDRMLREADLALYDAKEAGRGTFRFYASHLNAALQARRALEADLRAAIAGGGLRLNFQPLVDLATREVVGAEALLRWQHPVRGNVPPDAFIGLAERTGLIVPLGAWVLEEACRRATTWERPLRVAVNVSAVQFRHPGFLDTVRDVLARTGLPAARLELEVTESLLITDADETFATLERLRAIGIAIAMDDFGTGYSSLGTLQRFRFDKVKIDRGFVRTLDEDPRAAAIVRAILGMTEALGIRANAEGVETEEQAARLRQEGCAEVQGYLFGRPLESADFAGLVAGHAGAAA